MPRRKRILESLHAARFHIGGKVLKLHAEAEVGLVRAVALLRLLPGEPSERSGQLPVKRLLEDVPHKPLGQREDVIAARKRKLYVNLGELRLPVTARVLVTVTAGNLEVLVKARRHKELLVKLGRLGQRIELARIQAGRHEVVARALRGRAYEGGRLYLKKPPRRHPLPHRKRDLVPQPDAPLHTGRAQVKVAVLQAEVLVGVGLLVHLKGQHLGPVEDRDVLGDDLNRAGCHVGVHHRIRAAPHDAIHRYTELVAQLRRRRRQLRRGIGIHHRLGDAVPVPQVDERNAPVVPLAVHPPV